MSWLDNILGRGKPPETQAPFPVPPETLAPFAGLEGIRFGRYSDNNKSLQKTQSWYRAEEQYKAKDYPAAIDAFFEYISDEKTGNVHRETDGDTHRFEIVQGSRVVRGSYDSERILAIAPVAVMQQPATAVMRRLLEMNYTLYYTRYALDEAGTLCMVFDSPLGMASPNKLYYGLRELAKSADRQDDLLMVDFSGLQPAGEDRSERVPADEADIKLRYFRKWINDTLEQVSALNADSFAGAIAYAYLTLLYRIDFLITPESKLMAELEKISSLYWTRKDEVPIVERNALMKEALRKLLDFPEDSFRQSLNRSTATFSIVAVPPIDKVRENVQSANKDAHWYVENKYPELALTINEYGMVYNQFSYSMPRMMTELLELYMAVLHADFFGELGLKEKFYDPESKTLFKSRITSAIDQIIEPWKEKYQSFRWDHARVNYNSLWEFAYSFSEHLVNQNLEIRRQS
jgi:hypothetical protein